MRLNEMKTLAVAWKAGSAIVVSERKSTTWRRNGNF
jgi:hypothetical protein